MCLTSAVFGAFNIVCFSLAEVGCGYMDPEHTTELGVVFISSILLGIIPFVMVCHGVVCLMCSPLPALRVHFLTLLAVLILPFS